ncbi:MAG: hypothetical protein CL587_05125 [Alteromonadaceae bacterium]|nr:hypothetical protein [Alteromonadaceae bacterium]
MLYREVFSASLSKLSAFRLWYFLTGLVAWHCCEYGYSLRETSSSLFLNSLPNACAVVITTSLCLLLYPSQEFKSLSGVTAGLIIYECIQPYIPERTFDVMDILATAAGAVLMLALIITRRRTAKVLTHLSDS